MGHTRIVIGLDFGTTYSGRISVAWALGHCPDKPEVITSWPGQGNRTSPKVPSRVSYSDGKFLWGYQTTIFGENIRGLKILLDESQDPRVVSALSTMDLLTKNRKTAIEVTGSYLKQLVEHSSKILHRRFGQIVNQMDRSYVLTVPAVWSDKAKHATMTAAVTAGIAANEITLVSEPEAAALYCLKAIQPNSIRNGDVVVVCDAGGGTVDLISYCVKTVSPLRLEEVAEGSGGICGSMVLDVCFSEFLDDLIGKKNIPIMAKEMALRFWQEDIKLNFATDPDYEDEIHFVPVPGVKDNRQVSLKDGFLKLNGSQIKNLFDPVVQKVQNLIRGQIRSCEDSKKAVKAVFLVGGFGSSEYLFHRIKNVFTRITVMQPPNSWSAVMLGAVQHGIEGNQVAKRIARHHYGVTFRSRYGADLARYPPAIREWCDLEERWYVPKVMAWYIKKGDEIAENKPIRLPFNRSLADIDRSKLIFHDELLVCHKSESPRRRDETVFEVCTLESDLSAVPTYLFEAKTNSRGTKYYRVNYVLIMTPRSASITFELEFNGTSYGLIQSKY
ncbi:actin-like ATPase domain-containing protein [Aspergillus heteromorphus CBS 117.55]|uniref:Actin-like ATPase domain-containing protein n=1 Tax=Aspergillus heteromorphus CBS 117.55 TaxID=1448321 RepID=A0A317VL41_9EURO|nr:actin-like ATPase domain-containing protein [Aspergillus heteromorphus CBS 117.55]PWY75036.1 actin-like ATPase domain-containing protein [Aspergillus heteromorphus CBS 117.55]